MIKKVEKNESCSCESCNCGSSCCGWKILIILLALLWVIAAVAACIYSCKTLQIVKESYNFNILSAGGQENFDRMNKVYQSEAYIQYATENAEQAESYFGLNANSEDADTEDSEENTYNFDVVAWGDEIKTVVEDLLASNPARGDENARFTIIEYTELLCPYCQRHSQAGTINSTIEQFPGEVNSVSRSFIIHTDSEAPKLAEAMECVTELKPEIYHEVFHKAFEAFPISLDSFISMVSELGVNESSLKTCIDEGRYTQSVKDGMTQASELFGINWTPGNVIIDRETGNYIVVSGAYPLDAFIEAINTLKDA